MVRDGLVASLGRAGWTEADGEPDLVVVFVRSSAGLAEIRELAGPDNAPVIALLDEVDPDLVGSAITAGATSVVGWDQPESALVAAAELAVAGTSAVPTSTLTWLARRADDAVRLTDAERTWLLRLAEGVRVSDLADESGYSERSLYRQLNQLYHRLEATNRTEALAEARRRGLL